MKLTYIILAINLFFNVVNCKAKNRDSTVFADNKLMLALDSLSNFSNFKPTYAPCVFNKDKYEHCVANIKGSILELYSKVDSLCIILYLNNTDSALFYTIPPFEKEKIRMSENTIERYSFILITNKLSKLLVNNCVDTIINNIDDANRIDVFLKNKEKRDRIGKSLSEDQKLYINRKIKQFYRLYEVAKKK